MVIPSRRVPKSKLFTLVRASVIALCVGTGACKDPNPTFGFDAATDGGKEGGGDGSGQTDGAAGTGGGGGAGEMLKGAEAGNHDPE